MQAGRRMHRCRCAAVAAAALAVSGSCCASTCSQRIASIERPVHGRAYWHLHAAHCPHMARTTACSMGKQPSHDIRKGLRSAALLRRHGPNAQHAARLSACEAEDAHAVELLPLLVRHHRPAAPATEPLVAVGRTTESSTKRRRDSVGGSGYSTQVGYRRVGPSIRRWCVCLCRLGSGRYW